MQHLSAYSLSPHIMLVVLQAVDDAGHDRSVARKVEWIGKVDAMVGRVVDSLSSASTATSHPYVLAVTADHSTPVLYGDHAHEPVPVVIAQITSAAADDTHSPSTLTDLVAADRAVGRFDEVSCSRGVLGRFPGSELLHTVQRFCSLMQPH